MKKILVTGATGFIGNYVIEVLLKHKYEVIATSSSIATAQSKAWFGKVKYIPFNFQDFDSEINYYEFFDQPTALIHLAWEGLPNYKAAFHMEENLPRHFALLNNFIEHGLTDITVTGTCFEYGMQEGRLSESLVTKPANAYANAKDLLRKQLEELHTVKVFNFKWIRLFYMYGIGQSPNSLFSQLDKALERSDAIFNMSGGEQERDYLQVEQVAQYITKIALQNNITGIINCCSGLPVTVKTIVEKYLEKKEKHIQLNLGYYPYADYEPMRFWGDNTKINKIIMSNPIEQFKEERSERVAANGSNTELLGAAEAFNTASNKAQYSYNFSWMGRPIIQYPQDMIAMQEIIWKLQPDLIIETGIAHGGSLIYYASILELIGKGEVLGIDIDIREHNKLAIESHPMFKRIKMIQGSSIDEAIVAQVKQHTEGKKTILVVLDSNHTHEHVLAELEMYAPFVSINSYMVVYDTIVEKLPENYLPGLERPWGVGDNPHTAATTFLATNKNFEIDKAVDNKLLISVAPDGYLKRIK